MERIIFYSKENIASFLQNEKIDDYFSNIYPNKSDFEVNDILELYHICQYIDNGFLSEIWNSKKQIEFLKEKQQTLRRYRIEFYSEKEILEKARKSKANKIVEIMREYFTNEI